MSTSEIPEAPDARWVCEVMGGACRMGIKGYKYCPARSPGEGTYAVLERDGIKVFDAWTVNKACSAWVKGPDGEWLRVYDRPGWYREGWEVEGPWCEKIIQLLRDVEAETKEVKEAVEREKEEKARIAAEAQAAKADEVRRFWEANA